MVFAGCWSPRISLACSTKEFAILALFLASGDLSVGSTGSGSRPVRWGSESVRASESPSPLKTATALYSFSGMTKTSTPSRFSFSLSSVTSSSPFSEEMRPALRSEILPDSSLVAKFTRAARSLSPRSKPTPSAESTPRPTWKRTGSYPRRPRWPGPLPGLTPAATGRESPTSDRATRASRFGVVAASSSVRPKGSIGSPPRPSTTSSTIFDSVLTDSSRMRLRSKPASFPANVSFATRAGSLTKRVCIISASSEHWGRPGMKIETIDLNFMGTKQVIASFLLLDEGGTSAALVETGPTTCLDRLTNGLKDHGVPPEDVREVFLTHIHLDHAGASGHLAESLPNATFYVHELGYPHLADPSKLVKSAARIYGDRMDELWGDARPVPEERLVILADGDEVEAAGGRLVAHDTPGHAYHHLAYLEPDSGALFTGDVAGIRLPGQSYVRPPTPPPEIDVEAWVKSINHIRQVGPTSLWPTHFGRYEDVERHLGELEQRLQDWLLFVEDQMEAGARRDEIADELRHEGDAEMLTEGATPEESGRYDLAGDYSNLVDGLMRYVAKRRQEAPE